MAARRRKKKREGAPPAARAPGPNKLLRAAGAIVGLALVATVVLLVLVYPGVQGPGVGQPTRLRFEGGESVPVIVERLASAGLVGDARIFSAYLRTRGGWVARGEHLLPNDLSPGELVARLQRRGATTKVVLPEGWTRFDIARRLEKQSVCDLRRFLDATTDKVLLRELGVEADSAEGFLFPATYDLPMDSDPEEVVRALVRTFEKRWAALEAEHARGARDLRDGMGWTRAQIVTLASMIEKEAAQDEERPLVASVFLNRLRFPEFSPKLLQSDPTAAYGCLVSDAPTCLTFAGKVTHELLSDAKNPYNTYKHEGLPPGPIANPGAKSLAAVLEPASTKYLYFVAKGGGRHEFSETYDEHRRAVHDAGP